MLASTADIITGAPWRTSEDDDQVDGEAPEVINIAGNQAPLHTKVAVDAQVPKRVMIRQADLTKYGYSSKCPGCAAILKGSPRQGHAEECRRRIEGDLKNDSRMKRVSDKMDDFLEKVLEKEDEERRGKYCELPTLAKTPTMP